MPQYSTRAQLPGRPNISQSIRDKVFAETGGICYYCGWIAQSVDHIIPYSYGGTDELYNLVACCLLCNHIANNRIFDDIEAKRDYLLNEYKHNKKYERRRQLNFCATCGELFRQKWKGATRFLCAPCNTADLALDKPTKDRRKEIIEDANRRLREEQNGYEV